LSGSRQIVINWPIFTAKESEVSILIILSNAITLTISQNPLKLGARISKYVDLMEKTGG
jgi:hypothetical protein